MSVIVTGVATATNSALFDERAFVHGQFRVTDIQPRSHTWPGGRGSARGGGGDKEKAAREQ